MNPRFLITTPKDYPEYWQKWTKKFRGPGSIKRKKILRITGKAIPALFAMVYLFLAWAFVRATPAASIAYIGITLLSFTLVQLFCKFRNEPRPYETFEIKTLLSKKDLRAGQSFPSRTIFCVFMVAGFIALIFQTLPACIFLGLGALLAWIYVIQGVNYPRDVFAGAILGVVAAIICVMTLI